MATDTEKIVYKYDVDATQMNSELGKSNKLFGVVSSKALALGTATVGAGASMFKMADSASNLNEAMNVVDTSFGKNADEVVKWSETSIKSMGLSQTQALTLAGQYGDMGTAMGLSTDQAAKMSTSMVQLAADLSSFKNIPVEQAATALTGIFTGETESLKRLGIVMTETNLSQEEYTIKAADGSKETVKYSSSLSQAEKVQFRYKYVLDETKNSQGDFARTQSAMANQTRMLSQQFQALTVALGQKLLPAVTKIVTALNSGLSVAIALVSGKTANLSKNQKELVVAIQSAFEPVMKLADILTNVLGKALSIVTDFFQSFIAVLTGGWVTSTSIGSEMGMQLAYMFQFLGQIISQVAQIIQSVLDPILDGLKSLISPLINLLEQLWGTFNKLAKTMISYLAPAIAMIISFLQYLALALQPVIQAFFTFSHAVISLAQTALPVLLAILNPVIAILGTLANILLATVIPVLEVFARIVSNVVTAALTVATLVINSVTQALNYLSPVIQKVSDFLMKLSQIITTVVVVAFNVLQPVLMAFQKMLNKIWGVVDKVIQILIKLSSVISNTLGKAINFVLHPLEIFKKEMSFIANIAEKVSSALDKLSEKFPILAKAIKIALTPLRVFYNLLKSIFDIVQKIINAFQNVGDNIGGFFDKVMHPFSQGKKAMTSTSLSPYGVSAPSKETYTTHNYNITTSQTMTPRQAYRQSRIAKMTNGRSFTG